MLLSGLVIIPITEEKPAPGPVPGCGAYTKRFQTRIVGGKPADPNEWPWLAALVRFQCMALSSCTGKPVTTV